MARVKICPLLEGMKVKSADASYGGRRDARKQLARDLCLKECPLYNPETDEGKCIFDKRGLLNKEDREKLENRLKYLKENR